MPKSLNLLEIFFVDKKLRLSILGLQLLFLFSSLFEILGISSIGPLFYVLNSGEDSLNNNYLMLIYNFFDPSSFKIFAIYLSLSAISAVLLGGFFSIMSFVFITRVATYGGVYLGNKLFKFYLKKDWLFFLSTKKSKVINEIYQETSRVTENILVQCLIINKASYLAFFILLLLFFIDWKLTLSFFFFLAGAYALIYFYLRGSLNKNSKELTNAHEGRFKFLDETFSSMKEIHIWNNSYVFLRGFNQASVKWSKALRKNMNSANLPRFFVETFVLLSICIFSLLTYLNNGTDISILLSKYSVFIFSALKLLPALQQIFNGSATIAGNKYSLINLSEILNSKDSLSSIDQELKEEPKTLEIKNICFEYSAESFSIKDVSFNATQGNIIGITGFSGGGKSTLLDILMGLLRPTSGEILINNKSFEIYENLAWFRKISYLPQKISILNEDIISNIKFLDESDIDLEKLKKIQVQSNILEFFNSEESQSPSESLTKNLSGGQLQRLGIARTLYKDTKILFFDEPTSALDNLNKQHFISEMVKYKEEKIIFIVTHDMEILKQSDQVLVIDNGSLEFLGSYNEAINDSKVLQKLVLKNS
jgi:ABC-type bacteriocin/lantibiotic exporter with double-glycine peptidase domain